MNHTESLWTDRSEPDFNDLAWQTIVRLFGFPPEENPGPDEEIARIFKQMVAKRSPVRLTTVFANPLGAVWAERESPTFLCAARQLQRDWFRRFNSALCSARRVSSEIKRKLPIIQQLEFTGVLFLNGRHIFPNRWPDSRNLNGGHRQFSKPVTESHSKAHRYSVGG